MADDPMRTADSFGPHARTTCGARCRDGHACTMPPMNGGVRCRMHGGASKQARTAAARRLIEAEVRELFGQFSPEIVPVDNPLAAYAEFAGRVMAWMRLMDALLGDLRSVGYAGKSGEQVRAEVQLYERAMDRANTVLSSYARLNIDARLASITDQQVQMIVRAIDAVIAHFGATGAVAAEARKVGAAHLRVVGGQT